MPLPITTEHKHSNKPTLWKWENTILKELCEGYELLLLALPTHFPHPCYFPLTQHSSPQGRNAAAAWGLEVAQKSVTLTQYIFTRGTVFKDPRFSLITAVIESLPEFISF